ncbi:hypothetical protein OAW32_00745 [bacterium]|nr:hypothetical protein [bacterium]
MKNLTATLCLTIAVLLGSAGVSWSADFQKGVTAAQSGDYATTLREWEPLAEQGNASMQNLVGTMHNENNKTSEFDKMLFAPHPFDNKAPIEKIETEARKSVKNINFEEKKYNSKRFISLSECSGSCSFSFYVGRGVENSMWDIFVDDITLPSNWNYSDSFLAALSASKTLINFDDLFHIEPEIGFAKRFGDAQEFELWAAIYFRWVNFPWNHILKTTIGVPIGLNYASGIPDFELARAGNKSNETSRLMHFLAPEITFSFPEKDSDEIFVRFHHRSGAYGLFTDHGGIHFLTTGIRHRF